MKVLFVISCIVLYWIIGKIYFETMVLPMYGNPKDYDDLYRGIMAVYRAVGMDIKELEQMDKDWGIKWRKIFTELIANICPLCLIYWIYCDMKQTLRQLLIWLRG